MYNLYNWLLKLVHKISCDQFLLLAYIMQVTKIQHKKHKSVLVHFLGYTFVFRKPGKHLLTHFLINLQHVRNHNSKGCKHLYVLVVRKCRLENALPSQVVETCVDHSSPCTSCLYALSYAFRQLPSSLMLAAWFVQ